MGLEKFKCPSCSGTVTFKNNSTTAECDFCGAELHFKSALQEYNKENKTEIDNLITYFIDKLPMFYRKANAYQLAMQEPQLGLEFNNMCTKLQDALMKFPYSFELHSIDLLLKNECVYFEELEFCTKPFVKSQEYKLCLRYAVKEEEKEFFEKLAKKNAEYIERQKQKSLEKAEAAYKELFAKSILNPTDEQKEIDNTKQPTEGPSNEDIEFEISKYEKVVESYKQLLSTCGFFAFAEKKRYKQEIASAYEKIEELKKLKSSR